MHCILPTHWLLIQGARVVSVVCDAAYTQFEGVLDVAKLTAAVDAAPEEEAGTVYECSAGVQCTVCYHAYRV
jgi:hypothetical protein